MIQRKEVIFGIEQKPYPVLEIGGEFMVFNPYTNDSRIMTKVQFDLFKKLLYGMWNGEDTVDIAKEFIEKVGFEAYMTLID